MKLINAKQIKQVCHEANKQISKEALEALNIRVANILESAIRASGRFTRVTSTEVNLAK